MPGPGGDPEHAPKDAEQGLLSVERCLRAGVGVRASQFRLPGASCLPSPASDGSRGSLAATAHPARGSASPPAAGPSPACSPASRGSTCPGLASLATSSQGQGPGLCGSSQFSGALDEEVGTLSVALAPSLSLRLRGHCLAQDGACLPRRFLSSPALVSPKQSQLWT